MHTHEYLSKLAKQGQGRVATNRNKLGKDPAKVAPGKSLTPDWLT